MRHIQSRRMPGAHSCRVVCGACPFPGVRVYLALAGFVIGNARVCARLLPFLFILAVYPSFAPRLVLLLRWSLPLLCHSLHIRLLFPALRRPFLRSITHSYTPFAFDEKETIAIQFFQTYPSSTSDNRLRCSTPPPSSWLLPALLPLSPLPPRVLPLLLPPVEALLAAVLPLMRMMPLPDVLESVVKQVQ